MASRTTVWGTLGLTDPVAYGLTFIGYPSLQPEVNADQIAFKEDQGVLETGAFYLGTQGDLSGTDTQNLGGRSSSFVPVFQQNLAILGEYSGYVVRVSRGTRILKQIAVSGDFAGSYDGEAYLGASGVEAWEKIAGMRVFLAGAHATNPGGELRWGTKADNGVYADHLKLTSDGSFGPITQGLARLGSANLGYGALTLNYENSVVVGAVTINKPAGSVNIALGASSVVVTNSLVTAQSLVSAWLMQTDATLTFIRAIIPANGSFTINGNANAAANCKVGFLVISTDS